jgi:hypothetical protein
MAASLCQANRVVVTLNAEPDTGTTSAKHEAGCPVRVRFYV